MTGNLYQAFGHELVNQRRTQFELEARQHGVIRSLKRARRVDPRATAKRAPEARGAAPACCSADLG